MAEATALRNNALPYPVYGAPWTVVFPMFDADGDLVTGATTPDAEVSKNGDTFADCTNESTEIATSSGMYYLSLTATEMTADIVAVIAKSATAGMKTTPIVLYPRKLVTLRSGTVAANAADGTTLQLDSGASAVDDYYNGCLLVGTLDSNVEARVISDYVGSTKVCTVSPAFVTTPDNNDTFVVYIPDGGVQFSQSDLGAISAAAISTSTAQLGVNAVQGGGTAWNSGAIGASTLASDTIAAAKIATGAITSAKFAAGAIDAAAIAADAIGASELAADAVTEIRSLVSGTSDSGTTTTMVDAARTEADTDYWKGTLIVFTSGNISGQSRVITGFNAATDTITFAPATTQAVSTQNYEIWPAGDFLRPTTSGRTLDVSTGGEAGLDWANVGSPTTTVDLSGTTIKTTQKVDVDTIKTNPVVNGGTITFPTNATVASTTNITAGTVTTATNVTTVNGLAAGVITATSIAADAITAAKVADGTIDAATFAAGAINAAAIADGAIDAATFAAGAIDAAAIAANAIGASELAADAVTEIRSLVSGTSDSGSTTTMVDADRTEGDTDYWKGALIVFTSGNISGQSRVITAFNAATDTITFAPATTQAVSTQTYEIWPSGDFLRPTTSGRTLDVSTGGEAGLDWANIGSPTTTVGLSGTTVKTATDVETDTQDIQSRLPAALVSGRIDASVGAMAAGVLTATAIAGDAITAAKIADGAIDAATFASGAIDATAIAADAITAAKIADGAIDAATFATGAITAAAIAADAITDAKVASDVTIASVTGAVGSVTGNVGGNVTGSVGSVTGNVGGNVTGTIGGLTAAALKDFFDTDSTTDYASAVAGSVVKEIADNAGGSSLTAADIADAVWDEDATGHQTTGTFGQAIGDPGADTDTIWALVNTNLNATVSSRATQTSVDAIDDYVDTEVAAIKAKTDQLVFSTANRVDAQVFGIEAGAITATSIASDAITAAKVADGTIDAATFASGAINAAAIASDAITAAKIADGAIDAATFAAGAINAAAIAADAITDAKVASDVTIASVTGAVGSVTGAVGSVSAGGITAASFAANAITAAKLDPDVTTELQAGLATAAALTTVEGKIDVIDGIVDDILIDTAEIGTAGAGLTNINLPNQTMDIAGNITGNLSGSVGSVTGAVGSVTGNVGGNVTGTIGGLTAAALKDFFDTDSTTTYGSAVAGSVVKEIVDNAGSSGLTASDIADEVETRTIAAVTTVNGLAANSVTAAALAADAGTEISTAVWGAGTRTLTAGTNIALAKGTGVTGFNDLDAAGVRSAVGLASANLDTQLSAIDDFVDTEVSAIKAQTDKLTFDGANHIVADARKLATSATAASNLEAGATALVVGACVAGSTTTSIVTNLTEDTDDHFNGRVISFTSGDLLGQSSNITDYNGTTKTLTVTALTESPADTDEFVIS